MTFEKIIIIFRCVMNFHLFNDVILFFFNFFIKMNICFHFCYDIILFHKSLVGLYLKLMPYLNSLFFILGSKLAWVSFQSFFKFELTASPTTYYVYLYLSYIYFSKALI